MQTIYNVIALGSSRSISKLIGMHRSKYCLDSSGLLSQILGIATVLVITVFIINFVINNIKRFIR